MSDFHVERDHRHPRGIRFAPAHEREATTPLKDGTLLADCSCGETYSVTSGGNEYAKLDAARAEHVMRAKR